METTFDLFGNTLSTPVATPVKAGEKPHFGSTTSLHLLGRPLPGLAAEMKCKSVTDIRLAAAREKQAALSRASSSEVLNQL
ncbi:unnamed protein product [Gongylonema pulchrum]|uniref:Uncharacterized protein n=1 Tax=Gongylonema pulchrum TaxID=637853 RepID=A0A183E2K4_9BILA|nr:unnamed protein product [Gongylonema pulchrum]